MKRKLKIGVFVSLLFVAIAGYVFINISTDEAQEKISSAELREKHANFLANSPYAERQKWSRKKRKANGLPPNAYNDQVWELTMNPSLGRPTPELIPEIQRQLDLQLQARAPGDAADNNWEERGPNNIGGRTRALMFDPNDINNANPADDYTRVFAGGVSGGLWVNDDITDANSAWQLVSGLADNISVTVIISDPNDSNIMYLGSGESYTSGFAVGSGVYKSTDGGANWQQMIGGNFGTSSSPPGGGTLLVDGIFYVNDLVARDNNGTTEIYAAMAGENYREAGNPINILGFSQQGLYKSVDGGTNWSRFPIQYSNGSYRNPNDIEIDLNNDIWLATTGDYLGNPGGAIYQSTDGNTFNLVTTIPSAQRTEIEPSSITPGTFWIAADVGSGSQADIYKTTNNFASLTVETEPNDADNGIPASDYTRQQAFFNLPIEVDNNDNLYVGGIDLFKYDTNTNDWDQISKWQTGGGQQNITASFVHADQHAIVFRPNDNSQAIIGNDGGVYYSANFLNSAGNANAIQPRNLNYNVTQFYYGDIADGDIADGDDVAGGTQDNGSIIATDANAGINGFSEFSGGDGAYTAIDLADGYMVASFPFLNHFIIGYPSLIGGYFIASSNSNGSFINVAELDKNTNTLYADASGNSAVIGQYTNINMGSTNVVTTNLTNSLLNSRPTAFAVSANGQTVYAGLRNGRLLKIEAALTTLRIWSNVQDPGFVGSVSDIEFGETEDDLYVTFHNYGVNNVWYSPDAGASWQQKDGNLPDIPVKAILANPLVANGAEVIIGTELGVWRSDNFNTATPTWTRSDNGMRAVPVLDLDLRTTDNTVLATTHGRGMFTGKFLPGILSTEEFAADDNFSIYPTISDGNMNIRAKQSGKATITAYTIAGQQAGTKEIDLTRNATSSLNLSELSTGVYILKIQQNDATKTQKIVIQ